MSVELEIHHANMLIDGEWIEGEKRTDIIHPYDDETVGTVPVATTDQARTAVQAAA